MSTAPTNKTASEDIQSRLSSEPVIRPENLEGIYSEGPVMDYAQMIGDFVLATYKFDDGSSGICLTNGQCAFHIDNQNNMIFSSGAPSQSGCGGKTVFNTQSELHKSGSYAMEISGRPDDGSLGKEKNTEGNIEESKLPAYSLKIYGDCLIECVGGDVAMKGDNITLNATNGLNLLAGKDIKLQSGVNGGNIDMNGGTIKMDAAFFKKKISGGEYSDGAGEVNVEQYKPGSSVNYTSPGSVTHTLLGEYNVTSMKDYNLRVNGNYTVNVEQDFGVRVMKDRSELTVGKQKTEVQGIVSEKQAVFETWKMVAGPGKVKIFPSLYIESGGSIETKSLIGGIVDSVGLKKAFTALKMDEKSLNLNVGEKLGYLNMDPKGLELGYAELSSIKMTAAAFNLNAPAIFLN